METGQVGNDGLARTTSPPYPGFSAGGQYRLAKADTPDKLASVGFDAPPAVGYTIADRSGRHRHPVRRLSPLTAPTLTLSVTFLVYASPPPGDPVRGADRRGCGAAAGYGGQGGRPAAAGRCRQRQARDPRCRGGGAGRHRQGDDHRRAIPRTHGWSSARVSRNSRRLRRRPATRRSRWKCPAAFILGTRGDRPRCTRSTASRMRRACSPAAAWAPVPGGIGVACSRCRLTPTSWSHVRCSMAAPTPVFTPDLSSLYAPGRNTVAVIDRSPCGIVDADPSTSGVDYIPLPGNPFVRHMTTDPLGHFVFVAGGAPTVLGGRPATGLDELPSSPAHDPVAARAERRVRHCGDRRRQAPAGRHRHRHRERRLPDHLPARPVRRADGRWRPGPQRLGQPGVRPPHEGHPAGDRPLARPGHTPSMWPSRTSISPVTTRRAPRSTVRLPRNLERFATVRLTGRWTRGQRGRHQGPGGQPAVVRQPLLQRLLHQRPHAARHRAGPRPVVRLHRRLGVTLRLRLRRADTATRSAWCATRSGPPGAGPQYLGATTPIEDGKVTSVAVSDDGSRLFASYWVPARSWCSTRPT